VPAKAFRDYLKDTAAEKGTSVSRVLYAAADPDVKGLAPDTLKKALAGDRPLHAFQIKAIAEALGLRPEQVPHYRMAELREDLDERIAGPEKALQTLERLERADLVLVRDGTPIAMSEVKNYDGTSLAAPKGARYAAEMIGELQALIEGGDLTAVPAGALMRSPSDAAAELLRLQQEAARRTRDQRTGEPEAPAGEGSREKRG
jgi:lambda repressor-like predicted transcriptional regulator